MCVAVCVAVYVAVCVAVCLVSSFTSDDRLGLSNINRIECVLQCVLRVAVCVAVRVALPFGDRLGLSSINRIECVLQCVLHVALCVAVRVALPFRDRLGLLSRHTIEFMLQCMLQCVLQCFVVVHIEFPEVTLEPLNNCNTLRRNTTHCTKGNAGVTDSNKPSSNSLQLQHPETATPCNISICLTARRNNGGNSRSHDGNCKTLQHIATHCDTLRHTATHCKTLQHTATQSSPSTASYVWPPSDFSTRFSFLILAHI